MIKKELLDFKKFVNGWDHESPEHFQKICERYLTEMSFYGIRAGGFTTDWYPERWAKGLDMETYQKFMRDLFIHDILVTIENIETGATKLPDIKIGES